MNVIGRESRAWYDVTTTGHSVKVQCTVDWRELSYGLTRLPRRADCTILKKSIKYGLGAITIATQESAH
jgi:hypothetical protein